MSRRLLVAAAVAGTFVLSIRTAPAATTTYTLNISASVSASCTLSATAVSFGALSTATATNGTGSVTVNCTPGDSLTIALDAGSHAASGQRQMVNGSNFATYNLYQPTSAGNAESSPAIAWGDGGTTNSGSTFSTTGTGSNQVFKVYGQVPSGQTLYSGNYADAVTVTLTY